MSNSDVRELAAALMARVDAHRLRDHTMELVRIPSWPGEETRLAARYAEMLKAAGLTVSMDHSCPESPSVIGRWSGEPGPVLQLDGHTDTVPVEHPEPSYQDGILYGRGAADMKCGLAGTAEASRILIQSGVRLHGSLLVTAHGQHEKPAPGRRLHEPLLMLFDQGIKGDACIVPEGPEHELAIAGKGLFIWEVVIHRNGDPIHEVKAGRGIPNPIMAGHRFVSLLTERAKNWTLTDPDVGGEYFFVGAFQAGELYNMIPASCRLEGVRRYPAGRAFDQARAEFEDVAAQVAEETGLKVRLHVMKSGQPFRLREDDPVVRAVRWGYEAAVGRPMPLAGLRLSGDVSQFINEGRIPAVYCGMDGERAHATPEYARLSEIVRGTRVLIAAALQFLNAER